MTTSKHRPRRLAGLALSALLASAACGSTIQARDEILARSGTPGSGATDEAVVEVDVTTTLLPAEAGLGGSGDAVDRPSSSPTSVTSPSATVSAAGGKLQIGLVVFQDLGAATRALGVQGLATGNGRRQAEVAAGLVNAAGGLGGRRIEPVVVELNVTSEINGQMQAACSRFFDDNKVAAVVSLMYLPILAECTGRRNVPLVIAGASTTDRKSLAARPQLVLPGTMTIDRAAVSLVSGLKGTGYFDPDARANTIGLLYSDTPDYAAVPGLVAAQLKAQGLTLADSVALPVVNATAEATGASAAGLSAVLRFKGKGINRVIVVDRSGNSISYFAIGASTQGYLPRFAVTSLSNVGLLSTLMGPQQLSGTIGVGWIPVSDLPAGAQRLNPNGVACVAAMSGAGEDMNSLGTRGSSVAPCEGLFFLARVWQGRPATAAGFADGVAAMGTSYAPVQTFSSSFAGRRDGAQTVRPMAYQGACNCFAYTGPPVAAAP
jgi:hypothetical protein